MIEELNSWIVSNKAVVVTVGLPVFTVFVGFLGSYIQYISKKNEVRITGRIKLADARIAQFEALKSQFGELLSQAITISQKHLIRSESVEPDDLMRALQLATRISLQIRAGQTLRDKFLVEFSRLFEELNADLADEKSSLGSAYQFRQACLTILDKEWAAVETELRENK
ncbi:hypothetical protein KBY30_11540 [Ruegeria pomeroyi]|nr:hypothetical protein [Ruegeria pomeroyi]